MEEKQSIELSQKLESLIRYTDYLFPENDSKFVEGMIKRIFNRFKDDELGSLYLSELLDSLRKTISKYSSMMQEKSESKFGIGYLLKKVVPEIADTDLFNDTKKEIYKSINEIKHITEELHNTYVNTWKRLERINLEASKPRMSDEEIKKLREREFNNALYLFFKAVSSGYKVEKSGIGGNLIHFVDKKLTYELLTKFHKSPEDAYNKGIEFVEKEIIPLFEQTLNAIKDFKEIRGHALNLSITLLEKRISYNKIRELAEKMENPAYSYSLERYLKSSSTLYLLIIFALIGSSLFLISNKSTMMAVFSVNIIPLSLILGVTVFLLFLYFFFIKFIKNKTRKRK
jgi:hypothetical protein